LVKSIHTKCRIIRVALSLTKLLIQGIESILFDTTFPAYEEDVPPRLRLLAQEQGSIRSGDILKNKKLCFSALPPFLSLLILSKGDINLLTVLGYQLKCFPAIYLSFLPIMRNRARLPFSSVCITFSSGCFPRFCLLITHFKYFRSSGALV
jgi:hypothetical protein